MSLPLHRLPQHQQSHNVQIESFNSVVSSRAVTPKSPVPIASSMSLISSNGMVDESNNDNSSNDGVDDTYNSSQKQRRWNIRRAMYGSSRRLVILFTLILLTLFALHRIIAYRLGNTILIKAPINDLFRECDKPTYKVLNAEVAKKQKICLTTLTDAQMAKWWHRMLRWRNFDNLLELTWPNKQEYAQRHGYYLYDESASLDTLRPPSWSKIRAAQRLLKEESCDWVLWLDADTVIMNPAKKIEDFLPEKYDLLLTVQKGNSYNAGAWLVRNTEWSRQFLQHWWNMVDFVHPPGMSTSGDNAALKHYLLKQMNTTDFHQHIGVPPRCTFNSVTKWITPSKSVELQAHPERIHEQEWYMHHEAYHKGDLVAHVAGRDNKIDTIKMLLKDVSKT